MPGDTPKGRREWPGFLILVSLILAALLIFNLTAIADLTRDRYDVVAVVREAAGIRVGSPVRVAGIESGRVTSSGLLRRGDSVHVALRLRLNGETREVLRSDSEVKAQRDRMIGEPFIAIDPGSPAGRRIRPGDTLRALAPPSPGALLERGRTLPVRFDSLVVDARRFRRLAEGRADELSRLGERLEALALAGTVVFEGLEGGALGGLILDGALGDRVASLSRRVAELRVAVDRAVERYAPADGEAELASALVGLRGRVGEVAAEMDRLRHRLDERGGILIRMQEDTALQVALDGVVAQIDSLRAEAGSVILRMMRPW